MKIKKYLNIIVIVFLLFTVQIIYNEYTFSKQNQQIVDLQSKLNDNSFAINSRMEHLENDVLTSSQKSFVNSHKIPNKIYFCGDKINLDDPFIRESVEREFYSILSKQGQIQLYLKRIGRYSKLMEKHIKEKELPLDLKYLSVHESALLPKIRSRSRAV